MTNNDPITDVFKAFWRALRPDPLPPAPTWMSEVQRTAWELGAREGVAMGRELQRQEGQGHG